jgi:hypothetical protein
LELSTQAQVVVKTLTKPGKKPGRNGEAGTSNTGPLSKLVLAVQASRVVNLPLIEEYNQWL